MKVLKLCKHLFLSRWLVKAYFSKKDLAKIAEQIATSEKRHRAEIRVAIEASLHPLQILGNITGRQRAVDAFSQLCIWDTEENNGVLIYLLLADQNIEIIADRGIHKILGHNYWETINQKIIDHFKQKHYTEGIIYGISQITAEMIKLFPKEGDDPNELSNEVVIL